MVPAPSDVVARVQVIVLPTPPVTAALNVTLPPLQILAAGAVIVPQLGSAARVTSVCWLVVAASEQPLADDVYTG